MAIFEFRQNNSGGSFVGPRTVHVHAANAQVANSKALQAGIYFDGCRQGRDCSCCGDRWSRVWDGSADDTFYTPDLIVT